MIRTLVTSGCRDWWLKLGDTGASSSLRQACYKPSPYSK